MSLATLNFLGFGAQPPSSDWGLMVQEGRAGVIQGVLGPALVPGSPSPSSWWRPTSSVSGSPTGSRSGGSRMLLAIRDLTSPAVPGPRQSCATCRWASAPARPSAWSASPARASRPPRGPRCGCCPTAPRVRRGHRLRARLLSRRTRRLRDDPRPTTPRWSSRTRARRSTRSAGSATRRPNGSCTSTACPGPRQRRTGRRTAGRRRPARPGAADAASTRTSSPAACCNASSSPPR